MRRLVKGLAIASCRVDRAVRAESAALEATLREAVEDPRDVQRRNEDTLRRDLLELKRSTDGFTQAAREDRSGLSAPQLQRAHRQETLVDHYTAHDIVMRRPIAASDASPLLLGRLIAVD